MTPPTAPPTDDRRDLFARVPHAVIDQIAEIGGTATVVYLVLARFADADGRCWPSEQTIATIAGKSERTCRREIVRLVDHGLVEVDRQAGKRHQYTVLSPPATRADTHVRGEADPGHPCPVTPDTHVRSPRTPVSKTAADTVIRKRTIEEEPLKSGGEAAVLIFPCKGDKEFHLTQTLIDEFTEAYPKADVMAELRAALQWTRTNVRKRKTAVGMPKFLNGWLSRSLKGNTNGKHTSKRRGRPSGRYHG